MTKFVYSLTLAAIAGIMLPSASMARQPCAQRDQIIERLNTIYGEIRQSIGLAPNNGLFETYASPETGSWTILVTSVHGVTCVIASGQAFETLAGTLPPAGEDA
ncbi:hypothetical protein EDD53_1707 [Pacificibacter maritimus]|uniref:YpeB-like protein with protease inhibitory function n=1 Tax=Pacificibacter maritimus TaxID=762213 RepID=A0A3N4UA09_9RHOB|nr:hypothetical protein [Pacificibacter maritimus]RPE67302.1 hypothetical protein EDD53_1707 [Pacificibacter maritimus]